MTVLPRKRFLAYSISSLMHLRKCRKEIYESVRLQPVGRKIILSPKKPARRRLEHPVADTVKFDEKHSFVNGIVLAVGEGF